MQDTDNFPEVGDPSVLRPTLWTSGELRIRVGDYVTLGMQATYASSRVSDGSAYGTPPLDKPRSYGGFGPNLAVHIPLNDTTLLGFAAAVTLGVMPWTVYERTRPPGPAEHGFDPSSHRIVESGHDVAPLMRLSVGHRRRPGRRLTSANLAGATAGGSASLASHGYWERSVFGYSAEVLLVYYDLPPREQTTRARGDTMQINNSDKRILILWAVILTLAGVGTLMKWLGIGVE